MTNLLQLPPSASRSAAYMPSVATGSEGRAATLVELLERRVEGDPAYCAYKFWDEDDSHSELTIGQLDQRARAIGAALQQVCLPGDRVLLVYPPGLEFVSAFFGCLYAGVLPVPATYPKPRRPITIPSSVRSRMARRTVIVLTPNSLASSSTPGIRDPC